MNRKRGGQEPSAETLRLRADLDRTRRELARVKKEGPEAGAPDPIPIEKLEARIAELDLTKQRLGRLYFQQIEQNRRRSSKLHEILQVVSEMNADLDLDLLPRRMAETVQQKLGFRIVLVRLREPGTNRLRAAASVGLTPAAHAQLEREDVLVEDFESWLREEFQVSHSYFISHTHPFNRVLPAGQVADLGPHEEWEWHPLDVLLVPLVNGSGELVACFSVDDPVDRLIPSREVVELLEVFARQAAIAIENARLYRRLADRSSDLEAAGRRIQELTALKSNFVSTISNELRTPLGAIRAHVDTLLAAGEQALSQDRVRRLLGVVQDESRRLSRLIESVLDLGRFESAPPLARRPVDLAEILEQAAASLRPTAEIGQVKLKVVNTLADTRLAGDPDQIRQLVLQLGSNAVKYTRAGGEVMLRLEGDARAVTLRIDDTGIGIPKRALEKVSGRVHPTDSAMAPKRGGSGLGLGICKSIVEAHAGRMSVTSTPGRGSCFTVVLPRLEGVQVVVRPGSGSHPATEDVLRLAVEMVAEVMDARVVSIMALESNGDLTVRAAIGLDERIVREARVRPGQGVAGWVATHRRPLCVSGPGHGQVRGSGRAQYRTGTYLSVPLQGLDRLLGVLNVTDPGGDGRTFQTEDSELLLDLAERIGAAWNQAQSLETSRSGLEDTATALRHMLEHVRQGRNTAPGRIRLAQSIALEMGFSEEQIGVIGFAAAVHDVGMTMVGQDILDQRGELSTDQREEMRRHVEVGAELLRPLETMGAVREIVLSHHEWWDGTGYPRGLRATDIPAGARVLAVVDAFESLIAGRAHRSPQSREAALEVIAGLRGRQFDPDVVDAFERVLPRLDTERPAEVSVDEASATSVARR